MTAINNLLDMTAGSLQNKLRAWGEPDYRTRQIWRAIYQQQVGSFQAVTSLPDSLRKRLTVEFSLGNLTPVTDLRSADGRTTKALFRLPDGKKIETVLMSYRKRRTACISTQAGCALGCQFCATGQMGFERNLTVGEIVAQALWASRLLRTEGLTLTNIVLMGMGEPFHNYANSLAALDRLSDAEGMAMGARRITVSTAGLTPAIQRFAHAGRRERLAVSLHAATDELRSSLTPVNRRYPLAPLLAACREYTELTGRRLSFEWALIDGVNDSKEQAQALCELLAGMLCHVNLIPLNPTADYSAAPTSRESAACFKAQLDAAGIPATVRVRRGLDIRAGCGQLRSQRAKAQ